MAPPPGLSHPLSPIEVPASELEDAARVASDASQGDCIARVWQYYTGTLAVQAMPVTTGTGTLPVPLAVAVGRHWQSGCQCRHCQCCCWKGRVPEAEEGVGSKPEVTPSSSTLEGKTR